MEQKHEFHQFLLTFNDKKKDYFLNSVVGMKTWFYGLEILRNDRIITKVYGKLKNKNVKF